MSNRKVEWSVRRATFFLIGSTLATLLVSLGSYSIWKKGKKSRLNNPRHVISAIVQTGPEREALRTTYLAELLGLSSDRPLSLYAFDVKEGEKKLLGCPIVAEARIKRVDPGTLYIDYTVRKPVARLADYENIALDRSGYLFPLAPFFAPKNLPEIYLGLPPFNSSEDDQGRKGGTWHMPLHNKHLRLAFEILRSLDGAPWREGMRVKKIDVSNAFAPSYGQREIVLFTEEEMMAEKGRTLCLFPKILRLPTKDYAQQLSNFLSLRRSILEDYQRQIAEARFEQPVVEFSARVVDLRIPQLAFVQNHS